MEEEHITTVKRILCYIVDSVRLGCRYGRGSFVPRLVGYSDNDLGRDVDSRKSISDILLFLGSIPVTWQSQKLKLVDLSRCESKYVATTNN
jgi:hypothetical protein